MTSNKPDACTRFKKTYDSLTANLIRYLDDAKARGYTDINPELLKIGVDSIEVYPVRELMLMYAIFTIDSWEAVRTRDRQFFINNMLDIFGDVVVGAVGRDNALALFNGKDIDGASYVGDRKEGKLFNHFQSLCRICLSHAEEHPRFLTEFKKEYENYKGTKSKHNWEEIKISWTEFIDKDGILQKRA